MTRLKKLKWTAAAAMLGFGATSQAQSMCDHIQTMCMINCQHTFEWCSSHCNSLCSDEDFTIASLDGKAIGESELQALIKAYLDQKVESELVELEPAD